MMFCQADVGILSELHIQMQEFHRLCGMCECATCHGRSQSQSQAVVLVVVVAVFRKHVGCADKLGSTAHVFDAGGMLCGNDWLHQDAQGSLCCLSFSHRASSKNRQVNRGTSRSSFPV